MPVPVRRWLVMSAILLAAFAATAGAWRLIPAVGSADVRVLEELNDRAQASPNAVAVFLHITSLGAAPFLIWFTAVVAIGLLLLRRGKLAAAWIIVQLVGLLLIHGSKLVFGRPRPAFNGVFAFENTLSFPSGHALAAVTAFGLLAYLVSLSRWPPLVRRTVVALCFIVIVLVGFSRLFLGVHYLTDVIGGLALGGAWACLAIATIRELRIVK
jgi:undecaprenyl-diphosphatase